MPSSLPTRTVLDNRGLLGWKITVLCSSRLDLPQAQVCVVTFGCLRSNQLTRTA